MPSVPDRPASATELDGRLHAAEGRLSGGLSMAALGLAFLDWGVHLANAPFRRVALAKQAVNQLGQLAAAATGAPAIAPLPTDHRFRGPGWQQPPFNLMSQAFLLAEEWWAEAAAAAPGVDRANQRIVSFGVRQIVDMFSPSNVAWLNPEVI